MHLGVLVICDGIQQPQDVLARQAAIKPICLLIREGMLPCAMIFFLHESERS